MSGRGRPLKPLADKIAEGTFRADRANLSAPQPSPMEAANPFDSETDLYAWRMWEYVVPELLERYSVGKGDQPIVEAYCRYYQRAIKAALQYGDRLTTVDEMGVERVNPLLKVEDASWDRVEKFGARLGLDPINRNKIRAKNGPQGLLPGMPAVFSLRDFQRDRSQGPDDAGTDDQ